MMSDNGPPVTIGIVGCGRATTLLHLPALRFVSGAKVVALADPDAEALHRAAKQFSIDRCVADYRVLLDDPRIEAVAVCVPVQLHVEVALAALESGKHLFIEKPLSLRHEECDRLIKRAEGLPLRIMLGFNTRWHRLARRARTLIRQGILGPTEIVRSVLTSYQPVIPDWRKRRASGGGVLLEMAMHHFDLWRYLLEEEVVEVNAHSRSGNWEDESASVTARFAGGSLASGTFAECTTQNNEIEIYGRKGFLKVSFYRFDGLETSNTSEIPGNIHARIRSLRLFAEELPKAVANLRQGGEWLQSYVEEWRHLVDSIRTGVPVRCGLEDGRRALATALAAIESAATGKAVTIGKG